MKLRPGLISAALAIGILGCGETPTVNVSKVGRDHVDSTVVGVTSGTVRAEKIAELAFGTVGRVKELHVELGDLVKCNQILAEVENNDLKSRLTVAREELDRAERLNHTQAVSRSSLIQAQALYDETVTAYEKSLIRAPFDGEIVELNLEVGQLSQITAVIPKAPIRIIDTQPRYVRVEIDEVDLPKVQIGMPARIKILAVRHEPFSGIVRKVLHFVSSLREQDRTSEIELRVTDEDQLLPVGASADVEIVTESRDNVLTLSSRAILGRGGDRYVYLVENGRLKRRPIKIGIFGYTLTEITDGLQEGDEAVIPNDKVELADGLKVKVTR